MDTDNHYAPPGDDRPAPTQRAGEIADPLQRLWSTMIDWGFMILVTSLVASMIDFERFEGASALAWAVPAPHTPANLLAWRGAAVAFLVQALLIARSGQSLGKLLTGLRIVRRDGRQAGVFQGFVMREIPFRGVSFVAGSLMLPNLPVPLLAGLAGCA